MDYKYIISNDEKGNVELLLAAAAKMTGGTAQVSDFVMITTIDCRLAQALDILLPGRRAIDVLAPKKAKGQEDEDRRPARVPGQPKKAKGSRSCFHCHEIFENVGNEKLCPRCRALLQDQPKPWKNDQPWKVVGTGEHLTPEDLSTMLKERKIEVGTGLVHPIKGTYEVIDNGKKLTLEKVMA